LGEEVTAGLPEEMKEIRPAGRDILNPGSIKRRGWRLTRRTEIPTG